MKNCYRAQSHRVDIHRPEIAEWNFGSPQETRRLRRRLLRRLRLVWVDSQQRKRRQ